MGWILIDFAVLNTLHTVKSIVFLCFLILLEICININDIALATDPFLGPCHCLSIAYCLPLMHICSAIINMGPGSGPRAQGA